MKITKYWKEKIKKSTQRSTEGALRQLAEFLAVKQLGELKDIDTLDLPDILLDFYCLIKPKHDEDYATQSLKCIRAALNRHFRTVRGLDIVKDTRFVRTNEMFKGVLVESKKHGKGVRQSTPKISPTDLKRIAEYFDHDHMNSPNPKKLQRHLLFYIAYYFCCHGCENLYEMRKNTFKLVVKPDGVKYVMQDIDEADKNHDPEDTSRTNEGRMYGDPGEKMFFSTVNHK